MADAHSLDPNRGRHPLIRTATAPVLSHKAQRPTGDMRNVARDRAHNILSVVWSFA
jgi:hypothetical protein